MIEGIEGKGGSRQFAMLLAAAALLFVAAGCCCMTRGTRPEPPPAAESVASPSAETTKTESPALEPAEPEPVASSGDVPSPVPGAFVPETAPEGPAGGSPPVTAPPVAAEPSPGTETSPAESQPEEATPAVASVPKPAPGAREKGNGKEKPAPSPKFSPDAPALGADENRGRVVVARLPYDQAFPQDGPAWARRKEELVYRVEFLGVTMGYAQFSFQGKVILSGKEAYHLRVRAWTSDLLAIIYPINDTIDYYLDVRTMTPLRQEYTRSRKEDDVGIYDQEKGTIVYRYRKDGRIRKKVNVVPNVYDPVSLAYYFRTRGLKEEEEAQPMYAGRKVWEVSARPVGFERIRTDRGEFDTVIILPVIRRDGKIEDKGDLKMWMTRDERHIPVRVYAKFKKVRTWTLVGELLPDQQGG